MPFKSKLYCTVCYCSVYVVILSIPLYRLWPLLLCGHCPSLVGPLPRLIPDSVAVQLLGMRPLLPAPLVPPDPSVLAHARAAASGRGRGRDRLPSIPLPAPAVLPHHQRTGGRGRGERDPRQSHRRHGGGRARDGEAWNKGGRERRPERGRQQNPWQQW